MKLTLFASMGILGCHTVNVNANPISTASVTSTQPAKPKDEISLQPITLEVTSNCIVTPRNPSHEGVPIDIHNFNELETFPVMLPKNELNEDDTAEGSSLAKRHRDHPHHHYSHHSDEHNHNPLLAGDLFLEHGPVVAPSHPIALSYEISNISSISDTAARYLVIPIPQFNRNLGSLGLSSADASAPPGNLAPVCKAAGPSEVKTLVEKYSTNNDRLVEIPRTTSKSGTDQPLTNINKSLANKSHVGKYLENKICYDNNPPNGILPTIPRCLELLEPLRGLAEGLVYIEKAPHHTLLAACHFKALNKTHYDGYHVEHMRELCWNLFETIQQEGRRRWERCLFSAEDKLYKSSMSSNDDSIHELEHEVDKLSFRAYQLTPGLVKDFIAEHPDLSPDDIEWLMHDITSSDANYFPDKGSVSRTAKRSWIGDFFRAIISAEVDTTIKQIGKGVEGMVENGVSYKTSNDYDLYPAENRTKTTHAKKPHTKATATKAERTETAHTKTPRIKKDAHSNRIYVHGKYYPIAPINKYVNHPRATSKPPFSPEEIRTYLEFVRETRQLSCKQFKRLRTAVEHELKLQASPESFNEMRDGSQAEHSTIIQKRSGPPPMLAPSYSRPYQWNFPSNLATNPAYINLTLAWNNTVTNRHKEWISLQLRNLWALRVGDLCKISHSWTKDLSEESQEIQLNFKGLSLQRCKEIQEGTRRNWRVGTYWKSLRGDQDVTIDESE